MCSPASPGGEDKRPERAATVRRRGRARQSKSVDQESDPDTDSCLYCDQGDMKNEKLITCKDCSTTGRCIVELQTKVREVITITEKAPFGC